MTRIPLLPTLTILACATLPAAFAQDGAARNEWPSYGGTQFAWRYSALDQVNTTNVTKLAPAWIFQTGDPDNGLQSTPIVLDGVLYLVTARSQVFALDAASGKLIWNYKYPAPRTPGANTQNRSENRARNVEGRGGRSAPVRMRHHRRAAVRQG
jgi:alcohol dehydrogenase (cytochrome c)